MALAALWTSGKFFIIIISGVNITVYWSVTPCSLTDVYKVTEERTTEIFTAEKKADHGRTRHSHRKRWVDLGRQVTSLQDTKESPSQMSRFHDPCRVYIAGCIEKEPRSVASQHNIAAGFPPSLFNSTASESSPRQITPYTEHNVHSSESHHIGLVTCHRHSLIFN
jgi:hypothetical protein